MQKYNVATTILYGILFIDTARRFPIAEGDRIQAFGRNPERRQNVRNRPRPSGSDVLIVCIFTVPIGIARQQ